MSTTTATATSTAPTPRSETAIDIVDLNKWFGEFHVLKNVTLNVRRGERIVVCGPSGSGKSTLIRCINALEKHQKGKIVVDGVELTSDLKKIDEIRKDVGMVFQHFNLFPHLTILENCTLAPIWVKKMPKREANEVAERAEVAATGEYDWQVAVEHVGFGEARELADRLREDGLDAEAHWRHVLVGALTEERAEELVDRVRALRRTTRGSTSARTSMT